MITVYKEKWDKVYFGDAVYTVPEDGYYEIGNKSIRKIPSKAEVDYNLGKEVQERLNEDFKKLYERSKFAY